MALTVVAIRKPDRFPPFGNVKQGLCNITFDSSYALGGGVAAAIKNELGMSTIHSIQFEVESSGVGRYGYHFEYDLTNDKVKVLHDVPPVIHEEYVTVTGNVGYLKYPAAHIDYIAGCATAFTPTLSMIPIAGGVTPATGQCAVDMGYNDTTGVLTAGSRTSLTFLAGDSIDGAYVSYATQAWKDLADNMEMCKVTGVGADEGLKVYGNSNMVSDPVVTANQLRLGVDLIAVQSITWSDGGDAGTIKVPELLKVGGTPAATLEMEIDFAAVTTFAEIICLDDDMLEMVAGDIVRVVYIKNPGSGFISDRFTNAEIAVSADTITFNGTPLIYGSCGQIPAATSDDKAWLVAMEDALATDQAHWTSHPHYAGLPVLTEDGATDDNLSPAWIKGIPSEIDPLVPLELPSVDLSSLVVRAYVIGE